MKNIFKSVLVGTLSAVVLTGCIDEVVPTNGVSQDAPRLRLCFADAYT